jgi:pyruvate/2-oxoglutarate/acetoin dehydrogenase E1 component
MTETVMTYTEALLGAIADAMDADESVALVWGSLGGVSGVKIDMGAVRKRHADRIVDPPISEAGIVGICTGAAMAGIRPIIPIGTGSFLFRAWDQLIHEAGGAHYMSNGRVTAPITVHIRHGMRGGGGVQHSMSPQAMLWNAPGLEIAMPATPADAKGLMTTAIFSDNPTVFLDHQMLLRREGPVPDGKYAVPFGKANVARAGGDVTIVAASLQVVAALDAAEALAADGIATEVIDLRSLVPLDEDAILNSVGKTGRLVVADECAPRCSIASEIVATVAEKGFDLLRAPPARVTRPNTLVASSPVLEDALRPDAGRIAAAARGLMG